MGKGKMWIAVMIAALVVLWPAGNAAAGAPPALESRTLDGSKNNLDNPTWGSVGIALLRLGGIGYADGIQAPTGANRPSARLISNLLAAQDRAILNRAGASDFFWQWGQFLDHDVDLTPEGVPTEPFYISVPTGDPFFDPNSEGNQFIVLNRSVYEGGDSLANPRQQLNTITAFIDASNVYGSDATRAAALRTLKGGKLKTSAGNLLPLNTPGLPNAGGPDPSYFLAGDVRANEQIALTSLHTLFMREHNRLCDEIACHYHFKLSDEETYQIVRKIMGALAQVITYREFLPILLGRHALPPYRGYDPQVNPGIATEFSTAAYRFGHSMLSPNLLRVQNLSRRFSWLPLKDCFFNPPLIYQGGGIASLLLGLATQQAQELDNKVVDGVRNFLFGLPGAGGFDLASLNIQRGRDHGLADYNSVRKAYGLSARSSFSQVTSNPKVQDLLAEVYTSVDDMDLWVAGLAEDHVPGALVGGTFYAIILDQFTRLRDGDRFWYQNDPFFRFNPDLMREVENTRLSDIVSRNTGVGPLRDNVLLVPTYPIKFLPFYSASGPGRDFYPRAEAD
jgi:peroxidase